MKHNSVAELISHPAIRCRRESHRSNPAHPRANTKRRTISAIFILLSIVTAFAAYGVQLDPSWTYQGQLQRGGAAYTGTCDFQFSLWNALSAGTQQASPQSINGVSVVNGLFTVTLDFRDFGTNEQLFKGDAFWLGTSVQCSGDSGFTPLDPRQPITAAPYAVSLRPGATINDGSAGYALRLNESVPGSGATALEAHNDSNGNAVSASSNHGIGVSGVSGDGTAGVFGRSFGNGSAIYGENLGTGLAGRFTGSVDIQGRLFVNNASDNAIYGTGGSTGVYGTTSTSSGIGVWGNSSGNGAAVYGENTGAGYAGRFAGPVLVEGNLIVTGSVVKGGGSFRIDHPLDPANKFLSHSFVESPDMKNIYDGNVTTDGTGSAIVTLPDYFAALNRDFRYQLTVLGQFAQAIVSREIADNHFEIHTDKPGVKVSWQVTGIRQDAYAQANPIVVEESKPAKEQGLYLFPAGFGAGEEKQIGAPSRPATPPGAQQSPVTGPVDQASK